MSSESSSGCAPGESWETAPEDTHGNPSLEFFFFPNLLRTLKGLAAKPPQHAKRVNKQRSGASCDSLRGG